MGQGGQSFVTPQEAVISPLARRLFRLPGVGGVFLGADFISVTKGENAQWETLKTMVLGAIMDHFLSGDPLIEAATVISPQASNDPATAPQEDSGVIKEIKELLDSRIRPAVAQDGGDITFHPFDEKNGIVYVVLKGACSGCPSSTATLKSGIENMLRYYLPEVQEVRPVSEHPPLMMGR
eukprot:g8570.t1